MSLARMAAPALTPHYERRRPEQTLLYKLVDTHYPVFCAQLEAQGQTLPGYIQREAAPWEFEDFLTCGRLEHGFLRVRCEGCKHERLVAFSCKRVAALGAWQKARHCSLKCCRKNLCDNGC